MKIKYLLLVLFIFAVLTGCNSDTDEDISSGENSTVSSEEQGNTAYIIYEATDRNENIITPNSEQMETALSMLRERVKNMGYDNAEVSSEGNKRIRVDLPDADGIESVAQEIGETARVNFRDEAGNVFVDGINVVDANNHRPHAYQACALTN